MAKERVQRRLAAILAADVVGYSRMMDVDEAGTLARFKSLRLELFDPKTEQFGGRIFKNTGDGALVEFPSAVDAVQCAVDIQQVLAERVGGATEDQQIILRIGISLGDVIVDGGNPIGAAKTVASDGSVSEGGGGNPITGYTLISADNLDAAVVHAKGCPVLASGGSVEVAEAIDM